MTDFKKITIKDIAKTAGVSYATVSRALSGSPEISEETRDRVVRLCREMGYTRNYVARSMVIKETRMIGLVLSSVDNPFMSELAYNVELAAREQGYSVILCHSSHDLDAEAQLFELLSGRQVDGIILIPSSRDSYQRLKPHMNRIPTVFLSEDLGDAPVNYVAVDNYAGTFMGTEYLYSLGHRDILYFGRRKRSSTHDKRAEGYTDACKRFHIAPRILNSDYPISSIDTGAELALNLFREPPSFTAILASTDTMALGVLDAAERSGLRIPGDFSLMGFDNLHYADLPRIHLTSVAQPRRAMALESVNLLIRQMQNPALPPVHRVFSPTLIKRRTCQPPSAQKERT